MKPRGSHEDLEKFFVDDEPKMPQKAELKVNLLSPASSSGPSSSDTSGTFATTQGQVRVSSSLDADEPSKYSFYQPEFYQQFFNVDTMDVVWRGLNALWPFKTSFVAQAKSNPDLFGPFWIGTSLIFMMAACSNFAQYLGDAAAWKYDFLKVTYGAAVIYSYLILLPLLFWGYLLWADIKMGLVEVFCIYGYSLLVYIAVAVLCIIPIQWLQWVLVSVGCLISTAFLVLNLWQPLRDKMSYSLVVLGVVTALQIGLALTFRLYFFQFISAPVPPPGQPSATPSPPPPPISTPPIPPPTSSTPLSF